VVFASTIIVERRSHDKETMRNITLSFDVLHKPILMCVSSSTAENLNNLLKPLADGTDCITYRNTGEEGGNIKHLIISHMHVAHKFCEMPTVLDMGICLSCQCTW